MFGKKKLINILFWLTSKWVFQQELIILVPIQTILGFLYGGLCALRLERWLSAIFQSLSLPFSHQGLEMSQKQDVQASSTFLGLSRRGGEHETEIFFQSEEPTFLLQVTFLDQIFSSSFTYMKRHRDVHLGNFNNKKIQDILNSSMVCISKRYEKSA